MQSLRWLTEGFFIPIITNKNTLNREMYNPIKKIIPFVIPSCKNHYITLSIFEKTLHYEGNPFAFSL
jgi:hypothetical protein